MFSLLVQLWPEGAYSRSWYDVIKFKTEIKWTPDSDCASQVILTYELSAFGYIVK